MTTPEQPTSLPPFSGDDPACAKCGYGDAYTDYRAHGRCMHDYSDLVIGVEPNERLHRTCARCGYAWDERLAEAGAAIPGGALRGRAQ